MALMRWQHFSTALQLHTSLTLALPEPNTCVKRYPVMYLLHGGTENATTWLREANLEAISDQYGLAIVSLDGQSSAYVDMWHGGKYFTYLTDELPQLLHARMPVSDARQDTLIAGFSMGGQGALRAALRCPQQYGACFALSGARDMTPLFEKWSHMAQAPDLSGVINALGPIESLRGSDNDILALAERAARDSAKLPRLYLACGLNDYAVALSDAYHERLVQIGLMHAYYQAAGIHGYAFAEEALRWGLAQWFGQKGRQQ